MRSRSAAFPVLVAALAWGGVLSAQAVERADTPRRGAARVTFDPYTLTWEQVDGSDGRRALGAVFTGDSIPEWQPPRSRVQQDVRALTGIASYVASLGRELLAVRAERRVMPIGLEYGITNRLSLGVKVPIVRVEVRERYEAHPPGANVGLAVAADSLRYAAFLADLDTALARLSDSIAAGAYGCPGSPSCTRAQALLDQGRTIKPTLGHLVTGSPDTAALFLPVAGSEAGLRLTMLLAGLRAALADTFAIGVLRSDSFPLPAEPLAGSDASDFLDARLAGLGLSPFEQTPRRLRFFPGDVEVSARYRVIDRPSLATTLGVLVRLPTGHQDSPNDAFDIATGDHQTDVEGQWVQEVTVWHRLWLNLSARAGVQLPGRRERRIAPLGEPFAPGPPVSLRWDPGDYAALDVAPMYRFSPRFAAGMTGSWYTQGSDHYSATGSASPPAAPDLLDAGTAVRYGRVGFAVTYAGPRLEGGLSLEKTVSAAGGLVPVATVFRIVIRQSILLF